MGNYTRTPVGLIASEGYSVTSLAQHTGADSVRTGPYRSVVSDIATRLRSRDAGQRALDALDATHATEVAQWERRVWVTPDGVGTDVIVHRSTGLGYAYGLVPGRHGDTAAVGIVLQRLLADAVPLDILFPVAAPGPVAQAAPAPAGAPPTVATAPGDAILPAPSSGAGGGLALLLIAYIIYRAFKGE